MASIPRAARIVAVTFVVLAWWSVSAYSQTPAITLRQAAAPEFTGQDVVVAGQVSSRVIWSGAGDSYLLPVQDQDWGLILYLSFWQARGLLPGDRLQVRGTMERVSGSPALSVQEVQKMRVDPAPAPLRLPLDKVASGRYFGMLVTFEAAILATGTTGGGEFLTLSDRTARLDAFLARTRTSGASGLSGFKQGDRVRITGIASTLPHSDHPFEVLLLDSSSVTLLDRPLVTSQWPFVLLGGFLLAILALWLVADSRSVKRRQELTKVNQLAEEIMMLPAVGDIAARLEAAVPGVLSELRVAIYLLNRGTNELEPALQSAGPPAINLHPGGMAKLRPALNPAILDCFRNRMALPVPNTRRSPFFQDEDTSQFRSALFVPMMLQGEATGVMELTHATRSGYFRQQERVAFQHLANEAAAAFRTVEQKTTRERLYRTEKLAAAGQLISGIAGELRAPLGSIVEMSGQLKARTKGQPDREVDGIQSAALRASEIVSRLVAFGKTDQSEALPVDVHSMLMDLVRQRGPERKAKQVEIMTKLMNQKVMVPGSQVQLEQVFANLFAYAEKQAAASRDKTIAISTTLLARRLLVEVSYSTQLTNARRYDPFDNGGSDGTSLGLGLCRGIAQSHGGDIRYVRVSSTQARLEAELPMMPTTVSRAPAQGLGPMELTIRGGGGRRQITALLLEPETKVRRQLVDVLSRRGDRAVPLNSAEEAVDVAQRLRFDLVLCAVLPGLNWVELFERIRRHVGTFVLLTQGYDPDLAKSLKDGKGYVLSKPIDEVQLRHICDEAAVRGAGSGGD